MKIAFDAVPLVGKNMSGIGWCEAGQTMAVVDLHPENEYSYNYFSGKDKEGKEKRIKRFAGDRIRINMNPFSGMIYRAVTSFIPLSYSMFFGKDADITHFFNYIVPPFVKGKKVVTVYDMVYKAFPETMRMRTKYMLNIGLKRSMKRADRIITISEFSKSEILKYFPEHEAKIRVIPCGVDLNEFKPCEDKDRIASVRAKYKIDGDYFLNLGTLEPRKNLTNLILGYEKFINSLPAETKAPKLVLAGGRGWLFDSIFEMVKEKKLESSVLFTEYIDSEDRTPLMCGSLAFTFPSIYEGFGMPPLEAMACGVPVLTSDAASLPEVTGDSAVIVKADSVDSIGDGLKKLFEDPELRERLSREGLERAKMFTWENSAKMLYKVYEELV